MSGSPLRTIAAPVGGRNAGAHRRTGTGAAPAATPADGQAGQGLAEYALILALIAIVAIVALLFLGGSISSIISNVGQSL